MSSTFIKRYIFVVGVLWSLICLIALAAHLREDYRQTISRLQTRAATMLERDILYRDWVAGHGGVYVPVTETSRPNPHLEFLPERDMIAKDGRQFTLINPSYMTRQAFDMDNRLGDTTSKITSRKFLNPNNAPDVWETDALVRLEQGQTLVSDVITAEGQSNLRTMRPFYVSEECLKCHSGQGYSVGDIRGGLSISIPFERSMLGHGLHNMKSVGLFGLLWLLGLVGVAILGRKIHRQFLLTLASDQQLDHAEMSLNFLSNYDRRTNLPNLFKFEELLSEMLSRFEPSSEQVIVTAMEIRNHKQIVNTLGSAVGDALLKTVAERVVTICPPGNSVARLDENRLIVAFSLDKDSSSAGSPLHDMFDEACKPLFLDGHEFFPIICMGTADCPADASDAKELVQMAGSALMFCLEGKQSGLKSYSAEMQEEARNRLEIERGLRTALADNSFDLYLQPQVDATSGEMIGAEALLRWQHPERGYISPAEFIPIAEENGLILPIGEWVLQTAAIQAVELHQRFKRIIPIGVNVSAKQFQSDDFVDIIDEVLAIDGMNPEMLEIEITEGTFIEDIDLTIEVLTDLKMRGLEIAIDDFGTGYSSLGYLNKFPIDRLKIDRSFVAEIASNEEDRLLVSLIVEMGRKLGLNVIAEGVEDEIQRNLLVGMGCHAIQGFLFSRPLAFDAFCSWCEDQPTA